MALIKTAAEIAQGITGGRRRSWQGAVLEYLRQKPLWAVDRGFYRLLSKHLDIPPSRCRVILASMEKSGLVDISEQEPRVVTVVRQEGSKR